ncbi:hypothetical protein OTK49_00940 [Vibrio coralliirubri]|uniref:hypothetical protein n=1 Tax=Vibrio coralliirubri TaxID=1516159 RepID=UPI00228522B0|nr:hypothetical protein [Vibrio coralliirubri]MCY9861097.1 hypothetical protein [Vibrio coralliirubri]
MYLNKKSAVAIALGAVLLTGCKNGNNDSDIVNPPEPPPEVVTPVTEISLIGTPKAGSTISANLVCDVCDLESDKTYIEWTVTKSFDTQYKRIVKGNTLSILPTEENSIITMVFKSINAEGEELGDVTKVYDLSKGMEGGFDSASMHKFNADGFVIQINGNIFLSSANGTLSPSRVHLEGEVAAEKGEEPETVKEYAISMPALSGAESAYNRVELYEFPNKRWGVGADNTGKSTELVEFSGAELVIDNGDEFFVVKDGKISRYASNNLTTPIHEAAAPSIVEAFVGIGTLFQLSDNNAIYFPAKGDPRPELDIAITDMRSGSFFSSRELSGYITTSDELILLALPVAAFPTTDVDVVIGNKTSDEFTVIYKDKSAVRVAAQGETTLEVLSVADDLSVVGVEQNKPTLGGESDLADVIKLNTNSSASTGSFKVLATSEATNGMFFGGAEPNTSCSDLINDASESGVNVAAVLPNDSGVMFAADYDNVYACNLNHASDDTGKKLTVEPVDGAITSIELLKGGDAVYVFDGATMQEYTFKIPTPPEPEVPEDGEEAPEVVVPALAPIIELEDIGDVDSNDERSSIGIENHQLGQNMAIIMSDSSQFIVGKMNDANSGAFTEVAPMNKYNHLGTFCHKTECLSVHSNTEGDVTIQRIESTNKPAELNYEGLIERKEIDSEEPTDTK